MTKYEELPTEDVTMTKENFKCVSSDPSRKVDLENAYGSAEISTVNSTFSNSPSAQFSKIKFPGQRGNLYYAVIAATLSAVALGTHYSWTSPTIPRLQENNSWLPLTDEEASWVASLTLFGTMLGPFVGGWAVNVVGRRGSIFMGVAFGCIAWGILLAASEVWHLYVARYIAGVGGGMVFLACPMYSAEVSEPAVRGALVSLFAFFLSGGYLIGYIVGPFVSYSMLILASLVPSVLFFLLYALIPESPYFYMRRGQTLRALEALTWLRAGKTAGEVQMELRDIEMEITESMKRQPRVCDIVATPGARRALTHSMVVVLAQALTGIDVIWSYAEQIFIMAGSSFSSSASVIIIGVVAFISAGFGGPLARAFGIKNVLVGSGLGMSVFEAVLGGSFYFQSIGWDMSSYSLLPISSLVCFISFFTVGFGVLAWAVVAELFPARAKPLGPAVCTFANKLTAFLLLKLFLQVSDSIGAHAVFFFFAACCLLASLYVLFFLPDMRNMTLQEIEDAMEGRTTSENVPDDKADYEQ